MSEGPKKKKRTVKGKNGGTLTPVEKGQVLNPNGRPKGSKNWKTIMNMILDEECTYNGDQMTTRLALAKRVVDACMEDGDVSRFKEILDRTEGKVAQVVQTEDISERVPDTELLGKYNIKIADGK